ncbi:MAG: right-handed parallel beta-helix repeat-containing protein, partial [Thermomicrobia bacterium]|nr:right-handed parallel beta-helix repeat-containing protein [Thermomicrobia bacterium]
MQVRFSRRFHHVALTALLAFMLLPVLPGPVVEAASYTVGTAADSGSGSLRDAINNVNAGTYNTINFSIGNGAQTIALSSMLPAITAANVTINATTQPGYTGGALITINGSGAGIGGIGLKLFGGSTTVIGLVVAGFAGSGMYMSSNSNVVQNCVITANAVGINIIGANSNTIGGTAPGNRNTISGNSNSGILIGGGSASNQVQGNFIGTDASGTAADPNPVGVFITGASGNVVGPGNVISGNTNNGVSLDTNSGNVTFNVVRGNFIGTDVSGTAQVLLSTGRPQNVGVAISAAGVPGSSASNNTIGGLNAADRNIISGNFNGNVTIVGIQGTATANTIQGNYIGLDVSGSTPVGHCDAGLYIRGGSGNTIGPGNVISGNSRQGISSTGLAIDGSDNTPGSPSDPAQNNIVQGNLIGTDKTGNTAITNGAGIYIAAASNNIIGGTTVATRNIISGNSLSNGVAIDGRSSISSALLTATGNIVEGNYIGTTQDGSAAVANGTGLTITNASGNTVGGTAAGAGNVISGNTTQGISINILAAGAVAQNNVFQGNLVGTNAAGTVAVPNGYGFSIAAASGNTIGGTTAAARNIISGNSNSGIYLNGAFVPPGSGGPPGVSNTTIQGNYIGIDSTGNNALGNGNRGIQFDSASNNAVDSNVIANNAQQGVLVNGAIGDAITGNPIYANGAESIRLVSGGNNMQPAPNLTGAAYAGGNQVTVTGTVTGPASTAFRIDFFSNPTAKSQGKIYLGSIFPTSDPSGVVTINSTINANLSMPDLSATASPNGTNTSAFSTPVAVTFPRPDIRAVSPFRGYGGGSTQVTITGDNFFPGATVSFGGIPATSVT